MSAIPSVKELNLKPIRMPSFEDTDDMGGFKVIGWNSVTDAFSSERKKKHQVDGAGQSSDYFEYLKQEQGHKIGYVSSSDSESEDDTPKPSKSRRAAMLKAKSMRLQGIKDDDSSSDSDDSDKKKKKKTASLTSRPKLTSHRSASMSDLGAKPKKSKKKKDESEKKKDKKEKKEKKDKGEKKEKKKLAAV